MYRARYEPEDQLSDHEAKGFAIVSHRSVQEQDLHFTKFFPDDAPFEVQFAKVSEAAHNLHAVLRKPGLLTPLMAYHHEKIVKEATAHTTASVDNLRYESKQDVQQVLSMIDSFKIQVNQVKLNMEALDKNLKDNSALNSQR